MTLQRGQRKLKASWQGAVAQELHLADVATFVLVLPRITTVLGASEASAAGLPSAPIKALAVTRKKAAHMCLRSARNGFRQFVRHGALVIHLFLGVIIFGNPAARAAGDDKAGSPSVISFNIPAQALGPALESYARLANREILYDGTVVSGRKSGEVDGSYTPERALEILLAGTGIGADFRDAGFIALQALPLDSTARDQGSTQRASHLRYYAAVQRAFKSAFCRADVPGDERIAARLWIGRSGQVLQVKRLDPSGHAEFDDRVDFVLRRLQIGVLAPDDFPQPVTIVRNPDAAGAARECDEPLQRRAGDGR